MMNINSTTMTVRINVSTDISRLINGEWADTGENHNNQIGNVIDAAENDGLILIDRNVGGGCGDGGDYISQNTVVLFRLARVEAFISEGGNMYYHNLDSGIVTHYMPANAQLTAIGYGDPHGAGLFHETARLYVSLKPANATDIAMQSLPHPFFKTITLWATEDKTSVAAQIAADIATPRPS